VSTWDSILGYSNFWRLRADDFPQLCSELTFLLYVNDKLEQCNKNVWQLQVFSNQRDTITLPMIFFDARVQ
jgi:hypothetical protein